MPGEGNDATTLNVGSTDAAGAASEQQQIPKGLEKFSSDGKLDAAKIGEGYLELEKRSTQTSQKLSELERTLSMVSAGIYDNGSSDTGRNGGSGRSEEDDTEPVTRGEARSVVRGFLELAHPEIAFDYEKSKYKDEDFANGLKTFMAGLPVQTKQAIAAGDFATTDWAIKQFKALKGRAQAVGAGAGNGSQVKPNFSEGGSPSGQPGKTYTHAELRKLMVQNPEEYARIADSELGKAYEEGRVKE